MPTSFGFRVFGPVTLFMAALLSEDEWHDQ